LRQVQTKMIKTLLYFQIRARNIAGPSHFKPHLGGLIVRAINGQISTERSQAEKNEKYFQRVRKNLGEVNLDLAR